LPTDSCLPAQLLGQLGDVGGDTPGLVGNIGTLPEFFGNAGLNPGTQILVHRGGALKRCFAFGGKGGRPAFPRAFLDDSGHVAVESVTALRRNILWYSWYHPLRREPPPIVQLKFASIQRNTTRIV
jgi:hypothetical protein